MPGVGKRFGSPGGPKPGRPKGTPNSTTLAAREVAMSLLDETWRENARQRILAGKAPHLETSLMHYAWGKPKDTLAVESTDTQGALEAFFDRTTPDQVCAAWASLMDAEAERDPDPGPVALGQAADE